VIFDIGHDDLRRLQDDVPARTKARDDAAVG
jgi:hypothetical protein